MSGAHGFFELFLAGGFLLPAASGVLLVLAAAAEGGRKDPLNGALLSAGGVIAFAGLAAAAVLSFLYIPSENYVIAGLPVSRPALFGGVLMVFSGFILSAGAGMRAMERAVFLAGISGYYCAVFFKSAVFFSFLAAELAFFAAFFGVSAAGEGMRRALFIKTVFAGIAALFAAMHFSGAGQGALSVLYMALMLLSYPGMAALRLQPDSGIALMPAGLMMSAVFGGFVLAVPAGGYFSAPAAAAAAA